MISKTNLTKNLPKTRKREQCFDYQYPGGQCLKQFYNKFYMIYLFVST